MKIITGDTVLVTTGKDKGKTAKVLRVNPAKNQVVVEGVNIITRHVPKRQGQPGQKVSYEKPIDASNVKLVVDGTPTRVGYQKLENGKKVRIAKKTGKTIPNPKIAK